MSHLGGHTDKTNIDEGLLNYLIKKYKINSFLDIGCGLGGVVKIMKEKGIDAKGLEGDLNAIESSLVKDNIEKIDFSKIGFSSKKKFDLGYSCEVLEHIDEIYIDNIMSAFKACKIIVMTAAPPKWPGHHHVNCRNHEYWIKMFNKYNFYHYPYETEMCRNNSTMNHKKKNNKKFMKHRLLFFINADLIKINTFNILNIQPEKITENTLIISNKYSDKHIKKK